MIQFSSLLIFLTLGTLQTTSLRQTEEKKASIEGSITNEHGHPIENALLYLNKENKLIKVATSDTLGQYKFVSVLPDNYSIKISYVGYFKKEIKNIKVREGAKEELNITMKELRCKHGHTH